MSAETLRDRILWSVFGTDDGDLLHPDSELPVGAVQNLLVENVMPLVEEHTRLAVEKALAEQREAIADALIEAQKLHPSNAYWCQDLDQAARIVRDFGKES